MPNSSAVNVTLVPGYYSARTRIVWPHGFRKALVSQARQSTAELIHDNGIWQASNHFSAQAARQLKLPLIITPRGMLEPWALRHRALKKKLAWHLFQRRDLRTACVIHATSTMEQEGIRSLGLRQPIAVIPNGVDLPPLSESSTLRLPHRTVLFLSRLHPKKGLLNLVQAWARVQPKGWRVVIAGPDEDGHQFEVEARIRSLGLVQDFSFVGSVEGEAKWKLFQESDLFILPTYSENFGVVIAEALASGVPVITTRGAPWAELETHHCGWWIDINAEALAVALREACAASDEQRKEMGARGRDLVTRRYSWAGAAENMIYVYEWMLKRGPRPACLNMN